jgi:hypothetical protein
MTQNVHLKQILSKNSPKLHFKFNFGLKQTITSSLSKRNKNFKIFSFFEF